jgi:hypothetical protein
MIEPKPKNNYCALIYASPNKTELRLYLKKETMIVEDDKFAPWVIINNYNYLLNDAKTASG